MRTIKRANKGFEIVEGMSVIAGFKTLDEARAYLVLNDQDACIHLKEAIKAGKYHIGYIDLFGVEDKTKNRDESIGYGW